MIDALSQNFKRTHHDYIYPSLLNGNAPSRLKSAFRTDTTFPVDMRRRQDPRFFSSRLLYLLHATKNRSVPSTVGRNISDWGPWRCWGLSTGVAGGNVDPVTPTEAVCDAIVSGTEWKVKRWRFLPWHTGWLCVRLINLTPAPHQRGDGRLWTPPPVDRA